VWSGWALSQFLQKTGLEVLEVKELKLIQLWSQSLTIKMFTGCLGIQVNCGKKRVRKKKSKKQK
jgi:hypothetical protein